MAKLQTSGGVEITTEELIKQWKSGNLELNYTPTMQTDRISEAIKGTVPIGRNTPQKCPYGLYAEQLSGTSFTTPRVKNLRNWLYRILPSVSHTPFKPVDGGLLLSDFGTAKAIPNQFRWNPPPIPKEKVQFWQGLKTMAGAGSAEAKGGMGIHIYVCNESMVDTSFCNSDGDLLIVPQMGSLLIRTENGIMEVPSGFIGVIQRGIQFSVYVKGPSRGYIAEVFNSHFVIPDLGPIGANGLSNPRDYETVTASFEQRSDDRKFKIIQKFLGKLFIAERKGTVYDVVGWHGNYAPFRYDLSKYCVVNSVSYDHLDPSIFTVLTAPSAEPGVATLDFVAFPPRWSVHTNTFRPPYYHRNTMSEFMGNIRGVYEAKRHGFVPGGATLHSCMIAHGPDAETFRIASNEAQKPVPPKEDALAFMFESTYVFRVTDFALKDSLVQSDYNQQSWAPLKKHFKPPSKL